MAKTQKQQNIPLWMWHIVALIPVLIAAPNGMLVKVVSGEIDPIWINVLRFLVVVPLMIPFVIRAIPHMTRKNVKYACLQGVTYAISITSFVFSISLGQASYTAVISLGIPILLMLYSVYLTRENVSRSAVVGISIAALGAFTIVGFPLFIGQGFASDFHPLATLFALVNVASFPLAVIFSRKATEYGLPMGATFGLAAIVTLSITMIAALVTTRATMPIEEFLDNPTMLIASVVYMGIGVSLVGRMLTVVSYKHLGSAVTGGLYYIEGFMAILLPIIVLGERMTIEMLFGGLLILLGVIMAESHRHPTVHRDHHQAGHRHV